MTVQIELSMRFLIVAILLIFNISCNVQEPAQIVQDAMFLGNNQHGGNYDSKSVMSEPSIVWKAKTGGQVISSPTVSDGVVYIGSSDHTLYALDAVSGEIKWTYKTGGSINSTPLVSNGKVMFLSYDGNFHALDQTSGELSWKFKTGGEKIFEVKDYYNGSFKPDFWDFYLSSAIANDGLVYFGSSDENLYALDINSGKKMWSYKTEGSIHSSPAISDNTLVVGSWDSGIYALDAATGEKNWSYTTGRDTANYIWLGVQASPSISNGIVYVGSRDAKFYAINLKTGEPVWIKEEFDGSWMPSSAALGEKNMYTGSSDSFSFFSINKETGNINYKTRTNAYTFSSPAIDSQMAYIGSANGRLFGIELDSGDIVWEFQTIGSSTDTIGLFDTNGEMDLQRGEVLTANISDMPALTALYTGIFSSTGAILSSPVISNQVIYFGSSDGYIYAITDKKEE